MPQITQDRRYAINHRLPQDWTWTPGDLVYLITKEFCKRWKKEPRFTTFYTLLKEEMIICEKFRQTYGLYYGELSYAFKCAVLDFYIRIMAPYEAKKAAENGDVYEEELGPSCVCAETSSRNCPIHANNSGSNWIDIDKWKGESQE